MRGTMLAFLGVHSQICDVRCQAEILGLFWFVYNGCKACGKRVEESLAEQAVR